MREMKFRGKPVYCGEKAISWVYGTFKYIPCNVISPGATNNGRRELRHDKGIITEPLYGSEFEVLCDTIGQYTGLKDKNGNGVYEGDIVKRHCNVYGLDDIGVVKYDDEKARFVLYCKERHYARSLSFLKQETINDGQCTIEETFTYEIIGNIHDNPELLKEG